jgi:hypothetical protein
MTREKLDLSSERNLITSIIVNDEAAKAFSDINTKLFTTPYSKVVYKWAIEYYNKYGKACRKDIEGIYLNNKRASLGDEDEELNDAINLFLKSISTKYEENDNFEFTIDQGWDYLETQNKKLYAEKVQIAIENNKEVPVYESIKAKDNLIEYSGDVLLSTPFVPSEPLIPNFMMKGSCVVLVGSSKIGKSWLTLQIAISIMSGNGLFNDNKYSPKKRCHVMYLANEDTPMEIQRRLTKLKVNPNDMSRLHVFFNWKTRGAEAVQNVRDYVKKNSKVKIVVIDCLGTIRGKPNSRNFFDDDYIEIGRWRSLCHELLITILIIHHPKKTIAYNGNIEGDMIEMTSGTNAIGANADRTMMLTRKRNDVKAKLYSWGRDFIDPKPLAIVWEDVECGSGWVINGNGDIEEADYNDGRKAIMLFLGEDIKTTGEIAAALNRKLSATTQLLEKMESKNKIKKVGYGKWRRNDV